VNTVDAASPDQCRTEGIAATQPTEAVRTIGTIEDLDGSRVRVGTDYSAVTIGVGHRTRLRVALAQWDAFERLCAEAKSAAQAWDAAHPDEVQCPRHGSSLRYHHDQGGEFERQEHLECSVTGCGYEVWS
jgi:hypothetical protein